MPNSRVKNLINDRNSSCEMVTFLDDGTILGKFGDRYMKFTEDAYPLDQVEFEKNLTVRLGERPYAGIDAIDGEGYYVVYWHNFQFQVDNGVCKEVFADMPGIDREAIRKRNKNFKDAEALATEKMRNAQAEGHTAILVHVNRAEGFKFRSDIPKADYW